jgi:peptidoglycan/LPS O-acetylase OafA/YrhL
MKAMIGLYIIGIPICALVINQIQEAGKIRPHELKSMIALFGGITVIALACFAYEYFRNLLPRKRRLDALLEDYRGNG